MPRPVTDLHDPAILGPVRSCHRTLPGPVELGVGRLAKTGITRDVDHQRSPFWSAVLTLRGRGWYTDDHDLRRPLGPGSLLHRFTDRHHTVDLDPQQPYHEVYLVPGAAVLAALEGYGLVSRDQPVVQVDPDHPWLAWCLGLIPRLEEAGPDDLPAIALDMGRGLAELLTRHRADQDRDFAARARRELVRDPTARESLGAVAARLGLSEDAFRKQFRRACGLSAGRYRIQHRLERACTLLAEGRLSVAAIAEALGYPNASAFTTQFTRATGRPPSRWSAGGGLGSVSSTPPRVRR